MTSTTQPVWVEFAIFPISVLDMDHVFQDLRFPSFSDDFLMSYVMDPNFKFFMWFIL